MTTTRRARCTGAALLLAIVPQALAATKNWASAVGGNTGLATNWSPIGVPAAADDHVFGLSNAYTVTYSALTATSNRQVFKLGTVTLNMAAPHTATNGLTIGDIAGDAGAMTLTTGTLTTAGAAVIGNAAGASGTLSINDDDASLDLTTAAGDLTVGQNGSGTLSITGGGLLRVADRFTAGSNATSVANVTVSGVTGIPVSRSALLVDGLSPAAAIGAGGDVTMQVRDGALVSFAGDVNLAQGSASTSTLTIQGIAGIIPTRATMIVDDVLNIAGNQGNGAAGGTGTVNVNSGGTLSVGGVLNVGTDADGGTATLHMDSGGAIDVGSLAVGPGGTLDLDGGVLDVEGGQFTYHAAVGHLRLGGLNAPIVTLRSGATALLDQVSQGRVLTVGGGSALVDETADFDVREGATLTLGAGDVVIGESATDDGGMIVNGTNSRMEMASGMRLAVGQSGVGRLEAELGGHITGGRLQVAINAGADGFVLIENPGTTATFSQAFVGGLNVAAGGTGELSVNAQAVCTVSDPVESVRVWEDGLLRVTDATLDCVGNIVVHGFALIEDGLVSTREFMLNNGDAEARGQIAGATSINAAQSTLTLIGDLTVGDPATASALVNSGLIETGAHKLSIQSSTEVLLNHCIVGQGGEVFAPNGVRISPGFQLVGDGVIDADVFNFGQIVGTGTGLTFKRTVFGVGQGISGSTSSFISGGGFEGAGVIQTAVISDSTAAFLATGNLTMGNAALASGVNIAGNLRAGPHVVTLRDFDLSVLSGRVTLSGGTLVADNGISLTGRFEGFGDIDARCSFGSACQVTLTGDLTVGRSVPSAVQIAGGTFDVGPHTLTVESPATTNLPTLLKLGGGRVIALSLGSDSTDRIEGNGIIDAPIGLSATLSPGDAFDATGAITVTGTVTQANAGVIEIDIAGPGAGNFDRVQFLGSAHLGGTLDVRVIDGFVPADGAGFTVLSFASRTGAFSGLELPVVPNMCVELIEQPTLVNVTFHTLIGNLDGDNVVGLGDLSIVLANFGLSPASPADGDLDGDGDVDLGDLSILLAAFGTTCP